jgi:hypothetical protein
MLIVMMVMMFGFSLVLSAAPKKKAENFRFRFIYQPQTVVSQIGFSENNYNVFESRSIENYYGRYGWSGYSELGNYTTIGVFAKLSFAKGDVLPLRQLRTLNSGKSEQDLGIEAEFRPLGNFWIGASYNQAQAFTINHYEEKDYLDVLDSQKLYDSFDILTREPMYIYYFVYGRTLATRQINETFQSSNFQIYGKYEIGNDFISGFVGGGLDAWVMKRETKFQEGVYNLYPFSGRLIGGGAVSRIEEESSSTVRPFLLLGFYLSPVNGLSVGVQGKYFGKGKDANYYSRFILPAPTDTWRFHLNQFSLQVFVSFAL